MARTYPSARQRILDAAERVILEQGLGQLSIEAVIAEAKLSKGGFFYHFPTKNDLLGAVLERLAGTIAQEVEDLAGEDEQPRGSLLRARIRLSFDMKPAPRDRRRALVLALIEAASTNPAVIVQARNANRAELSAHQGQLPIGKLLVIQCALDGYWIAESLGTSALSVRQRTELRAALLALASATSGPGEPSS